MSAARPKRLPASQVDCKWWLKGYCSRGKTCHFKHDAATFGAHIKPVARAEEEPQAEAEAVSAQASPVTELPSAVDPESCTICYETPGTYGLLANCDHAFCLECIRSWRSSVKKADDDDSDDDERKKNSKTCPMCRSKSDFIIPSSIWPSAGQKKDIKDTYLGRLKTIPCRYFEESITATAPMYRFRCPFTNHCHYAHIHPVSKEPYTFRHGDLYKRRENRHRDRNTMDQDALMQIFYGAVDNTDVMEVLGFEYGVGFPDEDFAYGYAWD